MAGAWPEVGMVCVCGKLCCGNYTERPGLRSAGWNGLQTQMSRSEGARGSRNTQEGCQSSLGTVFLEEDLLEVVPLVRVPKDKEERVGCGQGTAGIWACGEVVAGSRWERTWWGRGAAAPVPGTVIVTKASCKCLKAWSWAA